MYCNVNKASSSPDVGRNLSNRAVEPDWISFFLATGGPLIGSSTVGLQHQYFLKGTNLIGAASLRFASL